MIVVVALSVWQLRGLTVDAIPVRWGRTKVVAKGDDKMMLNLRQIYEHILAARAELDAKELIA